MATGLVGRFGSAAMGDAGVGTVDVDSAVGLQGPTNQTSNIRFDRYIGGNGRAADLGSDRLGCTGVDVGDDDVLRAIGRKAPAQGAADAAAASGHDHDAVPSFHR